MTKPWEAYQSKPWENYTKEFPDVPQVDETGNLIIPPSAPVEDESRPVSDVVKGLGETLQSAAEGTFMGLPMYMAGAVEGLYRRFTEEGFSPEDAGRLAMERASSVMSPIESQTGQDIAGVVENVTSALPPILGVAGGQLPVLAQGGAGTRAALQNLDADLAKRIDSLPQIEPLTKRGQTQQKIAELIKLGEGDKETALFELASGNPKTASGKLRQKYLSSPIVDDLEAIEAKKQGFGEGVLAAVKASGPEDKKAMEKMVDIMEKGRKNERFMQKNRPSDIAGENLMNRIRVIKGANKKSGKELDRVANELKGQRVNATPLTQKFIDDLSGMGIVIGNDLKPIFIGSDIEGVKPAENLISNVVKRMTTGKEPDAYDLHRMKRFLDEQVTYGKGQTTEGLSGRTEKVIKDLRRNIDNTLDQQFPEYDRANVVYADTIGALNALQDVVGKKMDLTGPNADKALGTDLRQVMSNRKSRIRMLDSLDDIEETANKYINYTTPETIDGKLLLPDPGYFSKKGFADDLLTQILFADELDKVFKPAARTSFEGLTGRQQLQRRADVLTSGGRENIILEKGGEILEKAKGINEENAFKAIKDLLKKR